MLSGQFGRASHRGGGGRQRKGAAQLKAGNEIGNGGEEAAKRV